MRSMLITAFAFACAACAGVPGYGPVQEVKLDQVIPLRADGTAEGSYASGPFAVVKVEIRNQPTAQDVAMSRDKTWDMSHPKPVVTVRSTAQHTARVSLASILEDENGKPLMVCKSRLDVELAPASPTTGTPASWRASAPWTGRA